MCVHVRGEGEEGLQSFPYVATVITNRWSSAKEKEDCRDLGNDPPLFTQSDLKNSPPRGAGTRQVRRQDDGLRPHRSFSGPAKTEKR